MPEVPGTIRGKADGAAAKPRDGATRPSFPEGPRLRESAVLPVRHGSPSTASRIHSCSFRIECSEFTPQAGSRTSGPGR